ncbi:MAG: site-2 protease family protein, partial [Planctomycetia bacterium]
GRFAGIDVFLHWTFLLLLGWVFLAHLGSGDSMSKALEGVAFILSIFACVVLHEFGHALAAKGVGIATRDVTILPIGGVARLERMPDEPLQELWVALAGPLVNVVIAGGLILGMSAAIDPKLLSPDMAEKSFLAKLTAVNLALVFFNMLPAFPMDGGRVLRALLATRMDYVLATRTAASVGQIMAMLFGLVGLMSGNPFLVFIAFFVFLGAAEEAHAVETRRYFQNVPVREAMLTNFQSLDPYDTLERAVDELRAGSQHDFPVLDHNRIVGVLPRNVLLTAVARYGLTKPVGEVMEHEFAAVDPSAPLDVTYGRMRENGCETVPVVVDDRLVGLITLDNISEWVMVKSAINQAQNAFARDR